MKKIALILTVLIALMTQSCGGSKNGGGNLPVKFKTEYKDNHKWSNPYTYLTSSFKKEGDLMRSSHEIEFDGKNLYIDKGSAYEVKYDVVDYSYEKTDIAKGDGSQDLYIITAKQMGDDFLIHNVSISIAELNGEKAKFFTLPNITRRNELLGVTIMFGE